MISRSSAACVALGATLLLLGAPGVVEAQTLHLEGQGDHYPAYVPDVDGDREPDLASCFDFNISGPGTLCISRLPSTTTIATVYTVIAGAPHVLRGEVTLRRVSPTRTLVLPSTLLTLMGPLRQSWNASGAHDHLTDHNWQLEIEGVTQGA